MSGHIRRRGERSWELKFDVGTDPRTGRRITKYASFKGTKRGAQLELVRLAGMDPVAISRRLGHASPTITLNVYGHLFGNSDDRAAEIIEAAFGKTLTDENAG